MPPRAQAPSLRATAGLYVLAFLATPLHAADWPMSRFDAGRTSASPQQLAAKLHLHWSRVLPALRPAWPDQPKVQMDAAYVPVVAGHTLYAGSSRNDGVSAFDAQTGELRWHFFTDGPVRFAPVYWEGGLYFSSDDGYLYCLDAERGSLRWKFRGGPTDRNILGNGRLISTWPARGAPVVQDGTVYFGASIWPFMGIFLHALDARTGKVKWTNDGDGSRYTAQPHYTESFAGVAPQGALVISGDALLVPGGRSIPACYDRKTGKLLRYQLAENGKRGGGADVSAANGVFFNGGSAFDIATEEWLGEWGQPVVLTEKVVFSLKDGHLLAHDFADAGVREIVEGDDRGKVTKSDRWTMPALATVSLPWAESLIKAGDRLYAGGKNHVAAFDLPLHDRAMPSWEADVEGTVVRLLAGDDRLFTVTREGMLCCFGADVVKPRVHALQVAPPQPEDEWTRRTAALLKSTVVRDGYCVAWGVGSGRLVEELVRQTNLHLIVVEPDARKVQAFRERLVANHVYGERVAVHEGHPQSFPLPPYLASLMVCENPTVAGIHLEPSFVAKAFQALRPYGGVACFPIYGPVHPEKLTLGLARAAVRIENGLLLISRDGPLPGAADWTHEHADAANTRVSRDQVVKAPLGVLWFGGPSHDGILPRHGHGPQPQVIDGRLIIEGVDMVRAMDIYTGRILWETELPGVGAFYDNVAHQPGANASGTNFISASDGIYVVVNDRCVRLDPATGKHIGEFHLPPLLGTKESPRWGYINVVGDLLIGGADPLFDEHLAKAIAEANSNNDKPSEKSSKRKVGALTMLKNMHLAEDLLSASRHLVVMDRHTGKALWSVAAHSAFRHNATCAGGGRLYTIDRMSGLQLAAMRGHEDHVAKPRLRVFDLPTGKELWTAEEDVFGTWLSYSAKHDVLVEAGRVARDTMKDEPSGMRAYRADSGKVLWHNTEHDGPAILHGDTIIWERAGCDLLTGAKATRKDPITGEKVDWTWTRNYGCNTPMASEHLLTFRSGAAGYFDLCNDGGTGNFGGFRSSCTNNLVVAGGVLTVPDYTRTCTCNYQNQTSLALVNMADAEMWTSFGTSAIKGPVRRVGINLGAPGDRKAADGTLWLEYPSVGGTSPAVSVRVSGDKVSWFRRHAAQVKGEMNWVGSSGVKGAKSVTLGLDAEGKSGERTFTVRLYFAEPDDLKVGQRVFGVALQGKEVLHDFDVVREAGGTLRTLVKEFKGVRAGRELTVAFTPASWAEVPASLLCGLEVAEEP
jgi:outer membrane protein assembly factor BamB